jgi:N-methylhydantoinase B
MLTPIEIFENRAPIVIRERSLREGSGGAGRYRGGLGQVLRMTTLGDQTITVTFRPDKVKHPAQGLAGGADGAPGEITLDGVPLEPEPVELRPGSELVIRLPGGGGYGDPAERDPKRIAEDRRLGFIADDVEDGKEGGR